MADAAGRPVDATTSPDQATVKVEPCPGCGGLPHGSVGVQVECLKRRIRELELTIDRSRKP